MRRSIWMGGVRPKEALARMHARRFWPAKTGPILWEFRAVENLAVLVVSHYLLAIDRTIIALDVFLTLISRDEGGLHGWRMGSQV